MVSSTDDVDDFNDFDTLLNVAVATLRMAQLAAPCTGPEKQVEIAIHAVKACMLHPLKWSWDEHKRQSILEESE